jgi:predicted ATP-binding protein involved in virulence
MRISRILVTNLFGMFNHVVPFNTDERITIIHGLNGVGKTALLRLVNGVFNRQSSEINSIPFEEFRIEFDNDSYLSLVKQYDFLNNPPKNEDEIENPIEFRWHQPGKKDKTHKSPLKLDIRDIPFPYFYIERYLPDIRRVGSNQWKYLPTSEVMDLETLFTKFRYRLPMPPHYPLKMGWPKWLDDSLGDFKVRLVRAQRLLLLPNEAGDSRPGEDEKRPGVSEAVLSYSSQLRDIIKSTLAQSSTLNQSLDSTFPQRVMDSYKRKSVMSKDELLRRLDSNEQKRNFLIGVGLYDREREKIENPEVDDENIRRVLSVYVQDVEKKLGIFDNLAAKIDLLVDLINSRFSFKQMEIDKEKGFVFRSADRLLSPTNLSSGEQHELVLTYELLFQTTKDTLVLIDEPELSLHVGWQIRFLSDLQQIINLAQIDTLVATHSPQIINDRWDLTVKLGEVEE